MTLETLQKKYLPSSSQTLSPGDFFVLLSFVVQKDKAFLLAHPEYDLSPEETTSFEALLERRQNAEPVAYLTGEKEFYGRPFLVTRDTLIPRPETELLVEAVLTQVSQLPTDKKAHLIDIGTGSGAIIITLREEILTNNISFFAIDSSEEALQQAQKNKNLLTKKEISFLAGDLLSAYWEENISTDHHFIVANLPYLPEKMYQEAMADVRDYEPMLALVSGTDGLDHYRRLLADLLEKTDTGILKSFSLFLEIDPSQKGVLLSLLQASWPHGNHQIIPDLSGKERHLIYTVA